MHHLNHRASEVERGYPDQLVAADADRAGRGIWRGSRLDLLPQLVSTELVERVLVAKPREPEGSCVVPYSMRHTFASFGIAAGVSLFYLARLMGSSVEQIDRTYGHLLPESEDYLRGLLDTYDAGTVVAAASQ
jgi:integrase